MSRNKISAHTEMMSKNCSRFVFREMKWSRRVQVDDSSEDVSEKDFTSKVAQSSHSEFICICGALVFILEEEFVNNVLYSFRSVDSLLWIAIFHNDGYFVHVYIVKELSQDSYFIVLFDASVSYS